MITLINNQNFYQSKSVISVCLTEHPTKSWIRFHYRNTTPQSFRFGASVARYIAGFYCYKDFKEEAFDVCEFRFTSRASTSPKINKSSARIVCETIDRERVWTIAVRIVCYFCCNSAWSLLRRTLVIITEETLFPWRNDLGNYASVRLPRMTKFENAALLAQLAIQLTCRRRDFMISSNSWKNK